MPYDYNEKTRALINAGHITATEVFYFEETPLENNCSELFQFCQDHLETANLQFQIRPVAFFFNSSRVIGARAIKREGFYSVSMNIGSVHELHHFFREHFQVKGYPIDDNAVLNSEDTPVQHMMYQISMFFLYFHELAHLIQMSDLAEFDLKEDLPFSAPRQEYSLENHVREWDADLLAANYLCSYILDLWRQTGRLDGKGLELITIYVLTSLYCLFLKSEGTPTKLYYAEYLHPHPIIRLSYVQDYMLRVIELRKPKHVAFDIDVVVDGFFREFQRLSDVLQGNTLMNYVRQVLGNERNIEAYMRKIADASPDYQYLDANRPGRSQ